MKAQFRAMRLEQMTREEARKEAHRRWGDNEAAPGFRYGRAVIRQKNQPKRFEVGYALRRGLTNLGVYVSSTHSICGRGDTWEAAFADADADAAGEKSPIFTAP